MPSNKEKTDVNLVREETKSHNLAAAGEKALGKNNVQFLRINEGFIYLKLSPSALTFRKSVNWKRLFYAILGSFQQRD